MLLRLEEPLGGFGFKWRLSSREKSAANLQELLGLKEENCSSREAFIEEPDVESGIEGGIR